MGLIQPNAPAVKRERCNWHMYFTRGSTPRMMDKTGQPSVLCKTALLERRGVRATHMPKRKKKKTAEMQKVKPIFKITFMLKTIKKVRRLKLNNKNKHPYNSIL